MFSPDGEVDESFKVPQICKNCGRGHDMADRGSSDQCSFGCGDKLECEGFWCGLLSHFSYELVKAITRYCQASPAKDCRRMDSVWISNCRTRLHPVELHSCIWAWNYLWVLICFSSLFFLQPGARNLMLVAFLKVFQQPVPAYLDSFSKNAREIAKIH